MISGRKKKQKQLTICNMTTTLALQKQLEEDQRHRHMLHSVAVAWRGHGGRQPTGSSVEFDRQLDKVSIWLEGWDHQTVSGAGFVCLLG